VEILVKTMAGLEEVLIQELEQIGIKNCKKLRRAVQAEASLEQIYEANLCLRTGLHVLVPLFSFKAKNEQALYDQIYAFDWTQEFRMRDTFAINATVKSKFFNHSKYVALKTKDAIADKFTETFGSRPNVDPKNADYNLSLFIQEDHVIVYKNSSGNSLNRRGYRLKAALAPLNECLAAGLLLLAGYKGDRPFLDPMCGSGTLLAEAYLIASHTPPNLFRKKFGFQSWDNYDKKLFESVKERLSSSIQEPKHTIMGCDIRKESLEACFENLSHFNFNKFVQLKRRNFMEREAAIKDALVVFNPPYDLRVSNQNINSFYKEIGDALKQFYGGSEAWIISANFTALKHVGLRPSKKIPLFNGPLECKFQKYELYAGSKKAKFQG